MLKRRHWANEFYVNFIDEILKFFKIDFMEFVVMGKFSNFYDVVDCSNESFCRLISNVLSNIVCFVGKTKNSHLCRMFDVLDLNVARNHEYIYVQRKNDLRFMWRFHITMNLSRCKVWLFV